VNAITCPRITIECVQYSDPFMNCCSTKGRVGIRIKAYKVFLVSADERRGTMVVSAPIESSTPMGFMIKCILFDCDLVE